MKKTMVSVSLSLCVAVFVCVCRGSSSARDDVFSRTLKMAFQNLDAGLEAMESTEERLHLSRPFAPIGSWRDCGGPKTVARIKGFRMNETCLKTPGRILIAFNISAVSDVTQPISVDLKVQTRKGKKWVNVCDKLAGGCRRDDVCPKADDLLSSAAEETDADDGQLDSSLSASSAGPCIAKGFTIRTEGSYDVPKASPGTYRAVARFKKGSDLEVACLDLLFKVCA